jgi:hypothetical protein
MSDITEEEMRDQVERTLAIFFTGNRMPHMSGDPRERVPPAKRRDLSDAADNVLALIQPALERARREERERERERCAVMADAMAEDMAISIGKIGSQMTLDRYQVGANDIWSVAAAIRKG